MSKNNSPTKKRLREEDPELEQESGAKRQKLDTSD